MKVYYDTYPAIAFIARKIREHKYSPFNKNIEPFISFITLEEALHVLFSREEYKEKWYPGKSKKEAYVFFIQDILSTYKIIEERTDHYEIIMQLLDIITKLDEEYGYIERIKVRSNLPGFMDLIHFIFADKSCEIFITTDNAFEKLSRIKANKIKRIVVLNEENLSIEKEIVF